MTPDEEVEIAMAALSVFGRVLDIVRGARAGKIDPVDALGRINTIHSQLSANDAAIDAALAAKFPTKEGT